RSNRTKIDLFDQRLNRSSEEELGQKLGYITKIFLREGFIENVRKHREGGNLFLVLTLPYRRNRKGSSKTHLNLKRISTPEFWGGDGNCHYFYFELVQDAEQQSFILEKYHHYGNVYAVEKLRQSIEIWYATSEYLRQEMSPNFRMTDPLNPVHIMSFSGARGNASQVHQLVGMRGLMSDPQGQMIDLPIQSNLREGLSLTEYIISCYGARKGVVDTAVRTSDAGYLTRRLVEVVQHIVVRRVDCGTIRGISINTQNEIMPERILIQTLIGRVLADNIYIGSRCIAIRNQDIGIGLINHLINFQTQSISIRTPFTCRNTSWICRLCYGRSPTHENLVELGEAVGIIAGQSIGEPGTQLTLRTFHTGGVFTGGTAEHVRAPSNGKIRFNQDLVYPTRTCHSHPAFLL
ncbi:hypothetical protein HN873_047708, partial [Arachis hypogaea]